MIILKGINHFNYTNPKVSNNHFMLNKHVCHIKEPGTQLFYSTPKLWDRHLRDRILAEGLKLQCVP